MFQIIKCIAFASGNCPHSKQINKIMRSNSSERNCARWRHDLDARTHKVMTCSLSLSFSYWCETSLLLGHTYCIRKVTGAGRATSLVMHFFSARMPICSLETRLDTSPHLLSGVSLSQSRSQMFVPLAPQNSGNCWNHPQDSCTWMILYLQLNQYLFVTCARNYT
jgi:hypothetical protein